MTYGFEVGRIYNRRKDIHARFDGQRQGGIITPSKHPLVILISGEEGQTHGYADRLRDDGVFEYFGEGQRGDMAFVRGNAAIARHSADGKALLLFRTVKGGLRYMGEWVLDRTHMEEAPDSTGAPRQAIVFELTPLDAVNDEVEEAADPPAPDFDELRRLALAAANVAPGRKASTASVYERSARVREYVLARARGKCEGCGTEAPFRTRRGAPYLEPHHLRRLSDGGPDDPRFVIALCPTCHRRVHYGADGAELNAKFSAAMRVIEND